MTTADTPLYVDVDGTLLRTDLLFESICALIRRRPSRLVVMFLWLLRGRGYFKSRVADEVQIDVHGLPYNFSLIEYLRRQKAAGRRVFLASASDRRFVERIAAHLGFVDGVLATEGGVNLKGSVKAKAIADHAPGRAYAYAGNDSADLPVWVSATESIVVNASRRIERQARQHANVTEVIPAPRGTVRDYLRLLRPHQWVKNVLVFLPLVASHEWLDAGNLLRALGMFVAFGLCASGTYVVNDLLDAAADRLHATKKNRPLARGDVLPGTAVVLGCTCVLLGLAFSVLIGPFCAPVIALYVVITLAYSLHLKSVVILDVLTLAGLYTVRVIGGAAAILVWPSAWLLAFSMFLFLSLALVKRCTELDRLVEAGRAEARGRDYRVSDGPLLYSMGIASGYLAVLVVALYVDSSMAASQYDRPRVLWLICPLLLYWISRVWIKTGRREMNDDPIVYSAKDRTTWLVFGIAAVIFVVAGQGW